MSDDNTVGQSETICTGEDLYGLSLHELESRIEIFRGEISRLKGELEKKRAERNAADSLFGPKD